jgi:thiamine biosynthesis lipoprotein
MVTAASVVRAEPVMGTVVSFHVFAGCCRQDKAETAVEEACRELHRLEAIFSTWVADSPLSLWRGGQIGFDQLPPEVPLVLDLCRRAKELSDGWFDPWAMPGGVDPTGLVKGWAVEQAIAILHEAGVEAALANGGGDIALFGHPPDAPAWRVGIRHPWRPDAFACVLEASSAVATSGPYERGLHLIDPHGGHRTLRSASATVIGPSLAVADALATAVAVGAREALEVVNGLDGYGAYWIGPDGSEEATPEFERVRVQRG